VALAPADFYAYSRATGQPYPESPEERAMQAPQVLEFRRNQLKATESRDTNPVALGVGIALGLAGLGGAGLAARRMLRSGKTTGQSGISQVDLSDADFSNVRRAGAVNLKTTPTTVEPSKVATAPTRRDPFDLSSYAETSSASPQQTVDINAEVDAAVNRLLNDPGLLKYVEAEEAAEIMKQPAMRAEQSRQQAQVRRARSAAADDILLEIRSEPINTLVSQQQETGVFNVRQAIAALESGEDQQTGRIKSQLQRNEDLNLNQIGVLENVAAQEPSLMVEQDGPINRVASQLPDGLPVDQAEVNVAGTSATRFMNAERDKISRELQANNVLATPSRIEAELGRRLGPQASTYGPKYTARAQALQTFANTGSPVAAETIKRFGLTPVSFETFENMPFEKKRLFQSSAPMSLEGYPSTELQAVVNPTGIKVNAPGIGVVDIADLRKPVVTESTARQAEDFIEGAKADKLNWAQEKINEIEIKRQNIFSERKQRIEKMANDISVNLQQAKASGQNTAVIDLENQLENLRTLYKNPELGDYREFGEGGMRHLNAQRAGIQRSTNEQIGALEKRYPTTLANRTGEAARVFGERNVSTGEFIPETMEIRPGRSDVDLGRKGGGGRNIAEYTAGERLDEEIRAIRGGGRIRDYDPETGAPAQRWQGDSTQTGRVIDEYGVRLTGQRSANPEMRPSVPQYTPQEIETEALRLSKADAYGDVPIVPEYGAVVESLGYQQPTPQRRASVDVSETIRRLQSSRAPGAQQQLNQYIQSLRSKGI
jgi:hypothetical protein